MKREGFVVTERIVELQEKIAKLNKKAIKLGVEQITLEVTNETTLHDHTDDKGRKYTVELTKVICEGEDPKLNGWNLVAVLVHDAELGLMINVVPEKTLDRKYREAAGQCDHCGINRFRKETYVVEHENGETKVVGSSCLSDFLGGHKLDRYLFAMAWLKLMDEASSQRERGERFEPTWELKRVLGTAVNSINKYGYFSKAKAQEILAEGGNAISTADDVLNMLYGDHYNNIDPYFPTETEEHEAEKVIEYIKTLNAATSDYNYNLLQIVAAEKTTNRFMGYAVSMVSAYRRHMEKFVSKNRTSEYVSEVGKREIFELKYLSCHGFESHFGWTNIYNFEDAKGNSFVWMSTKVEEMEQGKTYKMKATVKDHKEFNNKKQTYINRPVFM